MNNRNKCSTEIKILLSRAFKTAWNERVFSFCGNTVWCTLRYIPDIVLQLSGRSRGGRAGRASDKKPPPTLDLDLPLQLQCNRLQSFTLLRLLPPVVWKFQILLSLNGLSPDSLIEVTDTLYSFLQLKWSVQLVRLPSNSTEYQLLCCLADDITSL